MTTKLTKRRQPAYYLVLLLFAYLIFRNVKIIILCFMESALPNSPWFTQIFDRGLFFADFSMRWKECGYVLHGINPFDNMDGLVSLPQYGTISDLGGMVPWEYILGNVFNPGFISFPAAKACFLFLTFVIISYAGFCGYRILRKNGVDAKWAALAFPIVLLPNYWINSMRWGNQGALLACLAFIFVCIVDEHPYIAGILLSFMMMKPQIGALFFIVLLLTKKFKTIFTAGGILCAAWGTSAILTQTSPIKMVTQMLDRGLDLNDVVVYGLFDFTRYIFSVPTTVALALSMLTGITFTVIFTLKLLKKENLSKNSLFLYTPAAIASTFWFYKQPHDLVILIIPLMLCYLAFCRSEYKLKDLPVFGGAAVLLCGNYWRSRICIKLFRPIENYLPVINIIDNLLIIAAAVVVVIYFVKRMKNVQTELIQNKP